MNYKVTIWRTIAEKQKGLQGVKIPNDRLFIFTEVEPGTLFHSRRVLEPFDIAFVDNSGLVLKQATLMPPNDTIVAPLETAYAIETKAKTFPLMSVGKRINLKAIFGA